MTQASIAPTTATTWQIDPAHSLVEFSVRHMMVSTVKGRFTDVKGSITYDATNPAVAAVQAEIGVASVNTGDAQRDGHLRSADFFDAEQYPTITFASRRVEPITAEHVRIIGDLTIRGTTREVVLDAEFNGGGTNPWGKQVIAFTAQTSINRKDFGLNWNVALETGGVLVSDTVKILLEIQAVAHDA